MAFTCIGAVVSQQRWRDDSMKNLYLTVYDLTVTWHLTVVFVCLGQKQNE